jgi:hypothetical protein
MCNYVYYQRLNYQTQPMSHWNVFRVFQTSWLRRTEFQQKIIEPLYSEINLNLERIEKFEQGSVNRYRHITTEDMFLFDQFESTFKKRIDEFFRRITEYNNNLNWSKRTTRRIVNNE